MRKNFKNSLFRLMSLTISIVFLLNSAVFVGNVFADDLAINFEEIGLEQFTYSKNSGVEVKSDGDNKFLNIAPKADGVSVFVSYNFTPEPDKPVELSYDFIINNDSTSGVTIASVSENIDQFLKIDAVNNKLYYTTEDDKKISFADDVYAGRWYNLKLIMDFKNNTYDVYLDNVCVIENKASNATYSYESKSVKFTMSTKYTPGFSIDNFSVSNTSKPNEISIEGEDSVSVANDSSKTLEYKVNFYDSNSNVLENFNGDYSYVIRPENQGVSISKEDNKLIVDISETAPAGDYELYAISGSMIVKKAITIERYESSPETIEILGKGKIAYGFNDNTYPFTVNVLNQVGDSINWGNFLFTLEGDIPEGIQVDANTGVVTVTQDLPKDHKITLKAVSERDATVYGARTLILEDMVTYSEDEYRLNAIITHVENVYKYGSDPYNGLPLIAQVIDRVSYTPGEWWETQDTSFVPSNQASISQFQRTCDALYLITGDKKYRDRVDESNKFFLENYVSEISGLPYWGGHAFIDLKTGQPNRNKEAGGKDIHEQKGHDPYMESLFRVAPEVAEQFVISFLSQHITNWDTMSFSRHGSFDKVPNFEAFYENTQSYVPSTEGFSPVYTTNLGFRESLYAVSRLCADLYRYNQNENALIAYMKLQDSYWKVASPDPDMWLEVPQNTTAGRYGYPDAAVEGLDPIKFGPPGQPGKWWLLDPIPYDLQMTYYGDRYWRARGDDMIAQGFITEEEQWKVRECYNIDTYSRSTAFLYWNMIDAIGEDHEFAEIIRERAIRGIANYTRLTYVPEKKHFKRVLIDGTDTTGFVIKRNGYMGGAGKVVTPAYGGASYFSAYALTYARASQYRDDSGNLIYQKQLNELWPFIKNVFEDGDLGCIGTNTIGDAGMDLNLSTTVEDKDFLLGCIYLYQYMDIPEFLDLARVIARNYIENHIQEGFIVSTKGQRYVYTGGPDSNDLYILALLEAAISGVYDQCSAFANHTGFYQSLGFLEHLGEQRSSAVETDMWNIPMPEVLPKEINITKDELELKVGETYNIEYTLYPNDAKNTSVYYLSSDDSCVLTTLSSSKIVAVKPGTAEIMVRSVKDYTVYDTVKVIVTE